MIRGRGFLLYQFAIKEMMRLQNLAVLQVTRGLIYTAGGSPCQLFFELLKHGSNAKTAGRNETNGGTVNSLGRHRDSLAPFLPLLALLPEMHFRRLPASDNQNGTQFPLVLEYYLEIRG
jgi:hypothetical protein